MGLTMDIRDSASVRELVTPEGVPLALTLASVSDRVAAFAIDLVIIVVALIVSFIAAVALQSVMNEWAPALWGAMLFGLLNGYFIWFELRTSGQTPGKRAVGIRVLSRQGGPLRADAVIARNLMRDLEFFIPVVVLLFRQQVLPDTTIWTWLMACGWLVAVACVPAFNRDRLRVGDLVAGTWVVRSPRVALRPDLVRLSPVQSAATPAVSPRAPGREPFRRFTAAELDVYGIFELQALEDVMRTTGPDAKRLRAVVAGKIARKIGHAPQASEDADEFLAQFYAALRAHHERRALFGERKERKDA